MMPRYCVHILQLQTRLRWPYCPRIFKELRGHPSWRTTSPRHRRRGDVGATLLHRCVLTGMVFGGSWCVIPHPLTITCVRNSSNSFFQCFFWNCIEVFVMVWICTSDWDITFFTVQILLKWAPYLWFHQFYADFFLKLCGCFFHGLKMCIRFGYNPRHFELIIFFLTAAYQSRRLLGSYRIDNEPSSLCIVNTSKQHILWNRWDDWNQNYMWSLLEIGGMKVCVWDLDHMTKMATMLIYGKTLWKSSSQDWKALVMQHWGLWSYQVYRKDDGWPWPILNHCQIRSQYLYRKKGKSGIFWNYCSLWH